MILSEYRNGGLCHCQNTKMEEYATVRRKKRRNMPLSEYRNGGIIVITDMRRNRINGITHVEELAPCQERHVENRLSVISHSRHVEE